MKLAIQKDQLLKGLQIVQNVVSTRTTLPILSNILLRAEANQLAFTATDLDVTISCAVPAEVRKTGATTLPAKRFVGIARELPTPEVELEVDDRNFCSVRSGAAFFRLNGLAAEEFPPLPQFQEEKRVTLPQEKARGMLRKTSFAVSTDETRQVLNGIFFSIKDGKVTLVATDGRRMALTEEEVEIGEEGQGEFILPTKAVNELNRLLETSGEVELKFTDNQAAFTLRDAKGGAVLVISKLVDGHYPNYRQVIPSEFKERIALVREEFLQALRRAELMTSEKSNSVKLAFGKNNLTITANTPDVGEARDSIAINYKGSELAIAFNPAYLLDPLKALENDEIYLELTDELSPGVVKINGPFLYVLMPMRMS
jgi:DNA polymerase-3 subunit beta